MIETPIKKFQTMPKIQQNINSRAKYSISLPTLTAPIKKGLPTFPTKAKIFDPSIVGPMPELPHLPQPTNKFKKALPWLLGGAVAYYLYKNR